MGGSLDAGPDRGADIASLGLIRGLDFDVVVPWATTAAAYAHTDKSDAGRRIDAILERFKAGESLTTSGS